MCFFLAETVILFGRNCVSGKGIVRSHARTHAVRAPADQPGASNKQTKPLPPPSQCCQGRRAMPPTPPPPPPRCRQRRRRRRDAANAAADATPPRAETKPRTQPPRPARACLTEVSNHPAAPARPLPLLLTAEKISPQRRWSGILPQKTIRDNQNFVPFSTPPRQRQRQSKLK